ncbi:hypothetical protein F2981_22860 (plasmid) [Sinorhizobium meliloti]|nr:hypothetical protein [Sinorhizobium meliloti]
MNANFERPSALPSGCRKRLTDLQQRSQAAALEVAHFQGRERSDGCTRRADVRAADGRSQQPAHRRPGRYGKWRRPVYNQYKSIVDQGPENAVKNATIPQRRVTIR